MKYNIEIINDIANQFAEMIETAVIEEQRKNNPTPLIAQIEKEMRTILLAIGREAMGKFLSSMQATPESEIECPCGGKLHYQRMRAAQVISVFDRVQYERAYYAGCQCKQGRAPLDEQFGLKPGAVTAGLATLLGLAGIEFSFDESPKWLREFLLFDVAQNTVRSETEKLGELQRELETELIQQSQDEIYLQKRELDPGNIPARLYGSMDAAKVRIEPRPKQGEKPSEYEGWRDMKVLAWFEVEYVSPAQQSKRQRQKAEREQTALRAKNLQYFCDIIEAEQFGKLLWASGCSLKADLSPELIFLGDGAVWIWNLVSHYYPNAVQIVDWYHAEEHLETLAGVAFSDPQARANWLENAKQLLWDGLVEQVIMACKALAVSCPIAQKTANYFFTNAERMRYAQFRAANYMIGSGSVESACKQIVTERLKLPGAQWLVDGAVQTAKARSAWLSGHWHSLCERRSRLPLAT